MGAVALWQPSTTLQLEPLRSILCCLTRRALGCIFLLILLLDWSAYACPRTLAMLSACRIGSVSVIRALVLSLDQSFGWPSGCSAVRVGSGQQRTVVDQRALNTPIEARTLDGRNRAIVIRRIASENHRCDSGGGQ